MVSARDYSLFAVPAAPLGRVHRSDVRVAGHLLASRRVQSCFCV